MNRMTGVVLSRLLLANLLSLSIACALHAQGVPATDSQRIEQLEAKVRDQGQQIDALRKQLNEQQAALEALDGSGAAMAQQLEALRARGAPAPSMPLAEVPAQAVPGQDAVAVQQPGPAADEQMRVGRPPDDATRPPEVAQIFDQPGVLTPRGTFILEPSLQTGYSANDRVSLIGYTVIPAILIGLIDVRQVKTTSVTAALAARYGLSNRLELELKVPYTYVNGDTVSREIFTGTSQDSVFSADGSALGDIELTARYQLPNKGPDRPYYVLWLRYKTRTGQDLFEVTTDCITRCVANATGTGLPLELPTGSGFAALQPGITWLYASDPVVFFGSFSYLHNFPRKEAARTVLTGAPEGYPQTTKEFIGKVEAGDILGFNVGVGLALNEKAAISIGYDQSLVGKTKQNGEDTPGSVRMMLGTLVLGGSYRFNDRASMNVALGVGVTRDTPDVSLSVRVPVRF